MKKPIVFFVTEVAERFNIDQVREFGSPVLLFEKDNRSPYRVNDVIADIEKALRQNRFDPQVDYIALTGSYYMVLLMMATVANSYDEFQVLMFSPAHDGYVKKKILLPHVYDEQKGSV